jgi:opacity protein-like surface antigen
MVIGRSHRLLTSSFLSSALASSLVLSTLGVSAKSPLDPAIGWDAGRIETGRSAAMSGANTAVSSSVGALFSNPANMAANRIYHVGAFASIWPEAARQTYGAAVVDSSTSSTALTGGLAAMWTQQDPDGTKRRGTDLVLGIAFPFSDKFRLGASLKYLSFRQQGTGPLGTSPVSAGLDGEPILRDFGIDAGFTLQPSRYFSAGVAGINLNAPGHGFMPTLLTAGLGGGTDEFTLEADVLADFTTWEKTKLQFMGGAELLIAEKFPLRAGYRYDQGSKIQWLSAGAGYVERSMGIELGVRRSVAGPNATAIVFSFTYHVESAGVGSTANGNY